jgi:hypothetical protein
MHNYAWPKAAIARAAGGLAATARLSGGGGGCLFLN